MRGLVPLFLGVFGTFTFSWVGLTVIPNIQIGAQNPQMDEEQTDIYPAPQSGMASHGREVYVANGCMYCHSQQVRADYVSSDIDRKWGTRRSAPRDYIFDRPVLLGKERMGPDLANVGKRGPAAEEKPAAAPGANPAPASPAPAQSPSAPNAGAAKPPASGAPAPAQPANAPAQPAKSPAQPSPVGSQSHPASAPAPNAPAQPAPAGSPFQPAPVAAQSPAANASPSPATTNPQGMPPAYSEMWHYLHLYSPRSMSADTRDSNMPAYKFLYEKRQIGGERSADALPLKGDDAPPAGWEIVPNYDAKCLVAYLMSLDQSHALKEVKSAAAPQPAAPAPAGSQPASPPPAPPKK